MRLLSHPLWAALLMDVEEEAWDPASSSSLFILPGALHSFPNSTLPGSLKRAIVLALSRCSLRPGNTDLTPPEVEIFVGFSRQNASSRVASIFAEWHESLRSTLVEQEPSESVMLSPLKFVTNQFNVAFLPYWFTFSRHTFHFYIVPHIVPLMTFLALVALSCRFATLS